MMMCSHRRIQHGNAILMKCATPVISSCHKNRCIVQAPCGNSAAYLPRTHCRTGHLKTIKCRVKQLSHRYMTNTLRKVLAVCTSVLINVIVPLRHLHRKPCRLHCAQTLYHNGDNGSIALQTTKQNRIRNSFSSALLFARSVDAAARLKW